jgi:hypothetical protein
MSLLVVDRRGGIPATLQKIKYRPELTTFLASIRYRGFFNR